MAKYSQKLVALALVLSLFLLACSTTTTFMTNSNVPLDVYVDGEYIGRTPVAQKELSDFVGSTPTVYALDSQGTRYPHSVTKEVKIGALIGGFFLWPLWLWVYGPKNVQTITAHDPTPPMQQQIIYVQPAQ